MTELPESPPADKYPDCMHCGLCLQACPTYLQTGDESMSPRGRLYLMKAVEEGRMPLADATPALDLCLDCRACEQACPSGVKYSRVLEPLRIEQHKLEASGALPAPHAAKGLAAKFQRDIIPDRRKLKRALAPVRLAQKLKLIPLLRASASVMPRGLRTMVQQLPELQPVQPDIPPVLGADGNRSPSPWAGRNAEQNKHRVAMFLGCAGEAMFPALNRATIRVLQAYGCEVHTPDSQVCCGALTYHAGRTGEALDQMATNAVIFGALPRLDAIIMNAAGCGATMKEAGVLGRELAADKPQLHQALDVMAALTRDVHEFLAALPSPKFQPLPLKVVYDDACHLKHAQGISDPPRQLLQQIPKLQLLPLPESDLCCGAAGSYALNQPQMSQQLGQRKADHILASGADVVLSANIGCIIQIQKSLREVGGRGHGIRVLHPLEILDQALPKEDLGVN